MNDVLTILGTSITILSFIYAIYENRRNAKLVNYNRDQAWEIYRQSSNALAVYQELAKLDLANASIKFKELLSKGETYCQELINNCIRMIKRFEKKFDSESIELWARKGLLPNESHIVAFKHHI